MRIKAENRGVERLIDEDKDCTVRALANAAGLPYNIAHRVLEKAGRKPKRGATLEVLTAAYKRMGFVTQSIHGSTKQARYLSQRIETSMPVQRGISLQYMLPRINDGRYIVLVRGHVFAVVNGKVMDYGDNPAGCSVVAVYKLENQAVVFDK
jgi:hypothetical protein